MVNDFLLWVFWGVVIGFIVSLIFPETKKYLLGTVTFGVLGSVLGGIIYGFFKIGETIYFHQGLITFSLFLFAAVLLTGLAEKAER